MRMTLLFLGLFALLAVLLPLLAVGRLPSKSAPPISVTTSSQSDQQGTSSSSAQETFSPSQLETLEVEPVRSFRILDRSTGKVAEVSVRDYVRGAVASELPAAFHLEAMKAQAVAAHTYALRCHLMQQAVPDPNLKGADFSADPSNLEGYATEVSMKRRWGELGDYYWNKVCEAADSTLGYLLVYEEEPIVAAYHAISGGVTEDAGNVWLGGTPYLAPVESPGDRLAEGYDSTASFTQEELRAALTAAFPDVSLNGGMADWIEIEERSESGYVTKVLVGDQEVHGQDLRTALGLRSTHFTLDTSSGKAVFSVQGYGHGVGLSQTGADYMARQGSTFDEILLHYYPGAKLVLTEQSD